MAAYGFLKASWQGPWKRRSQFRWISSAFVPVSKRLNFQFKLVKSQLFFSLF